MPACTVVLMWKGQLEDSSGFIMSVSLCYRAFDTLGLFHALLCKWRLSVVPGILITSGSQTDSCLWGIVLPHLSNVFCVCGTFHSVSQSSLWALIESCGIPPWHVLYCLYAFIEERASICLCLMCAEVTLVYLYMFSTSSDWTLSCSEEYFFGITEPLPTFPKIAIFSAVQEKDTTKVKTHSIKCGGFKQGILRLLESVGRI